MKPPKSRSEKTGLGLMIAGFLVLLLAGTSLVLQSRGVFPAGGVGRHLLLVGLGIYILGRLLFWKGRRVRR